MKYIILTAALFMGFTTFAQNLSFSRVIDTVLVVNTGLQEITGNIIYGEILSPQQGKVWKLQSIITNKERLNAKLVNCGDLSEATSSAEISINLTIDDGANFVLLSTSGNMLPFDEGYELQIFSNVLETGFEYPIWINSGSTLRSNIAWNGNNYSPSNYCFGAEQIGKIYVSILEFDTE